jgi:preprotein translocase subunit SecE
MISPVTFVQEVVTELKKVSWPSFAQTRNMTILVIIVSLLMGVYVGGADYLFTQLMNRILGS